MKNKFQRLRIMAELYVLICIAMFVFGFTLVLLQYWS